MWWKGSETCFHCNILVDNFGGAAVPPHSGVLVSTKNAQITYTCLRLNWLRPVWNVNISLTAFLSEHSLTD